MASIERASIQILIASRTDNLRFHFASLEYTSVFLKKIGSAPSTKGLLI